jgi:hypothetical protein
VSAADAGRELSWELPARQRVADYLFD